MERITTEHTYGGDWQRQDDMYREGLVVVSDKRYKQSKKLQTPIVITHFDPNTGKTTYYTVEREHE